MIKVSELTGAKLDYWVAKADNLEMSPDEASSYRPKRLRGAGVVVYGAWVVGTDYSPSTDWSQGGPIIEREHIQLKGSHNQWRVPTWKWMAWPDSLGMGPGPKMHGRGGDTALIAAMRAFVASKFGEEVPDE